MAATIQDAARLFRRLEREWPQRARSVLEKGRDAALDRAEELSSGAPLSAAERRRAPFATRHPQTGMDPSIIHAKTGRFLASWSGMVRGDEIRIWNNAPQADLLLGGTATMVPRPLLPRVEKEIGPQIARALADELEGMIRA